MKKILILLFCTFSLMASSAFAEYIKVGGGGASIATVFIPVRPHFQKATGLAFINHQSTPKDGLKDLLTGKVDVATAAVPLENMIKGAEKDGVKVDAASLQQVVVAQNKTVAFVHKNNPVTKLNKEQLKGIFTGKISNWKEVGGEDQEILVVWGRSTPGQNGLFVKQVFDGEAATKETLEVTDYASIKNTVSSNPNSIGIDPLSFADDSFKAVSSDVTVESPIIMVTKGAPSPDVKKLIDYIKGEGQKYITH